MRRGLTLVRCTIPEAVSEDLSPHSADEPLRKRQDAFPGRMIDPRHSIERVYRITGHYWGKPGSAVKSAILQPTGISLPPSGSIRIVPTSLDGPPRQTVGVRNRLGAPTLLRTAVLAHTNTCRRPIEYYSSPITAPARVERTPNATNLRGVGSPTRIFEGVSEPRAVVIRQSRTVASTSGASGHQHRWDRDQSGPSIPVRPTYP